MYSENFIRQYLVESCTQRWGIGRHVTVHVIENFREAARDASNLTQCSFGDVNVPTQNNLEHPRIYSEDNI